MIIRQANLDDRTHLEDLFVELQAFERTLEPHRADPASITGTYLDGLAAKCAAHDGCIRMAESDGAVVGFVCVLADVDSGEVIECQRRHAYIMDVAVTERLRGMGIGKALLAAAEEYAGSRGTRRLRIGALAGNAAARRLYEALGFTARELLFEESIVPKTQPN